jgi:hypothetical protein
VRERRRVRFWPYVLTGLWLAYACPAFGAGADATALVGIKGFRIEIESVSKAARELGMDEHRLLTATHKRLRRATLEVGDFSTVLSVSLHTAKHPTTVLAYCLDVEVRQVVHPVHTSQVQLLAPIWAARTLTIVTRTSLVRSVEGALTSLLDDLVRDYYLVNQGP